MSECQRLCQYQQRGSSYQLSTIGTYFKLRVYATYNVIHNDSDRSATHTYIARSEATLDLSREGVIYHAHTPEILSPKSALLVPT